MNNSNQAGPSNQNNRWQEDDLDNLYEFDINPTHTSGWTKEELNIDDLYDPPSSAAASSSTAASSSAQVLRTNNLVQRPSNPVQVYNSDESDKFFKDNGGSDSGSVVSARWKYNH
jgi:hypothetical protein